MEALLLVLAQTAPVESRPWHYWVSVPLVVGGILLVIALLVGYAIKVVRPQYPNKAARQAAEAAPAPATKS